ncbi:hypothetical protein ZIOFF_016914 [Zingiber officinale]|uniref:ACT domain-containing protein ACR n=1 Tax=Zingiber officinale TaxID=94328 RepID=A0A8J5LNE8_ZINOF|nr:hypothetical protein ZIOFF_016914 [Zingiber officinale]
MLFLRTEVFLDRAPVRIVAAVGQGGAAAIDGMATLTLVLLLCSSVHPSDRWFIAVEFELNAVRWTANRFLGFMRVFVNLCRFCYRFYRNYPRSSNSPDILGSSSPISDQDDSLPMPIVHIDQDSDAYATTVQLSFGDRLGALVDTMRSLKDLGLDVTKRTVTTEDSVVKTKFLIMRE